MLRKTARHLFIWELVTHVSVIRVLDDFETHFVHGLLKWVVNCLDSGWRKHDLYWACGA